ncbi:MAG: hypothetical protein KDE24_07875, partial [Caldilinea sp.]|nr:hypothetical protein [Caldilinea sp.]
MRNVGMMLIGVLLLAALVGALGGLSVPTASAEPLTQRATSTPTPVRITPTATPTATLSVARILVVTPLAPLTMTTVLTTAGLTTTVLLPVQIVTASTVLTGTASVTTTVTATPRATPRPTTRVTATPTPAPSGIVDFRAVASRLRGRVDLSWGYKGDTFDGSFLVERSTNGSVWRFVKDCVQPFDADAATYKCS